MFIIKNWKYAVGVGMVAFAAIAYSVYLYQSRQIDKLTDQIEQSIRAIEDQKLFIKALQERANLSEQRRKESESLRDETRNAPESDNAPTAPIVDRYLQRLRERASAP